MKIFKGSHLKITPLMLELLLYFFLPRVHRVLLILTIYLSFENVQVILARIKFIYIWEVKLKVSWLIFIYSELKYFEKFLRNNFNKNIKIFTDHYQ